MPFLPPGYELSESSSEYLLLKDAKDFHFRILSPAVVGWIDWKQEAGKAIPVRTKVEQAPIDPTKPAKEFWAFVVWDYINPGIKIFEITQVTIKKPITVHVDDPKWGDPAGYDIKIAKTGADMATKYAVTMDPPSEITKDILDAYAATPVDLKKLFTNEDPFKVAVDPATIAPAPVPAAPVTPVAPVAPITPAVPDVFQHTGPVAPMEPGAVEPGPVTDTSKPPFN